VQPGQGGGQLYHYGRLLPLPGPGQPPGPPQVAGRRIGAVQGLKGVRQAYVHQQPAQRVGGPPGAGSLQAGQVGSLGRRLLQRVGGLARPRPAR
jgi:hypothetical protein